MEHRRFNEDETLQTTPLSKEDLERIRARKRTESDSDFENLNEGDIEIVGKIGEDGTIELEDSDIEEIIEELNENDILPSTPPPIPQEALRVTPESSKNSPMTTGRENAQDFPVTDEEQAAYEAKHNPINQVITAPERGIRSRQMATKRGDAVAQKRAVAAHTEKHRDFYDQAGERVDIGKQKAFQAATKGDDKDFPDDKSVLVQEALTKFGVRLNLDGTPAGLPLSANRRRYNQLLRGNTTPESAGFFGLVKKLQPVGAEMRTVKKDGLFKKIALWTGLSAGAAGATAAGAAGIERIAYDELQSQMERSAASTFGKDRIETPKSDFVSYDARPTGARAVAPEQSAETPTRKVEKKSQSAGDQIKIGDSIAFPTTGEKKIVRQPSGKTIESITVPGPGGTADIFLTVQKPGEPIQFKKIKLAQDGSIAQLLNLDYTGRKVVGSVEYAGGGVKTEGNGNAVDIITAEMDMRIDDTPLANKNADDARAALAQIRPTTNKK